MWLFDIFKKKKEKKLKRRKLIIICSIASTVAIIGIIVPCVMLLGKKGDSSKPQKLIISGEEKIIAVQNQFGEKQYTANENAVSWSLTGVSLPIGLIITPWGLLSWTKMVTSIINTFEFTIVAKKEGFENGTLPVSFTIE